jgi:hypothetical protein
MSGGRPLPLLRFFRIFAGPAIWFLHLMALYGAEGLACLSPATADFYVAWSASAATLVALAALGFLLASEARLKITPDKPGHDTNFLNVSGFFLVLISGLGVLWSAVPVLLLPACASHV